MARKVALGQCVEMTAGKDPTPCAKWAVDVVDGRPLCAQHAASAVLKLDARQREERRRAEMRAKTEESLAGQQARWQETLDWHAEKKARGLWPYD